MGGQELLLASAFRANLGVIYHSREAGKTFRSDKTQAGLRVNQGAELERLKGQFNIGYLL